MLTILRLWDRRIDARSRRPAAVASRRHPQAACAWHVRVRRVCASDYPSLSAQASPPLAVVAETHDHIPPAHPSRCPSATSHKCARRPFTPPEPMGAPCISHDCSATRGTAAAAAISGARRPCTRRDSLRAGSSGQHRRSVRASCVAGLLESVRRPTAPSTAASSVAPPPEEPRHAAPSRVHSFGVSVPLQDLERHVAVPRVQLEVDGAQ